MLPLALVCGGLWILWAIYSPVIDLTWIYAILIFLLGAASAAVLSGTLISLGKEKSRSYRVGFFATIITTVLLASLPVGFLPAGLSLPGAAAGLLGAAAGALAFTSFLEGAWEDNYPPSRQILEEVQRIHLEQLGRVRSRLTAKRVFDIFSSFFGLVILSPLILAIALVIWLEDPGPVLFVKNSVTRGGKNFHQYKFRTMIREAEKTTGPVLSSETDDRVLWMGRFLRKTALDELPQFYNILLGEMSFVGPRPQRTVLVHDYLQTIPGYAGRHAVAPGLAGLAQVVGSYFMPPEEKLVWDLRYIQKSSLVYDIRLVGIALLVVFWLRWKKDWDDKIPENWIN